MSTSVVDPITLDPMNVNPEGGAHMTLYDVRGNSLGTEDTPLPTQRGLPPLPAAGGYYSTGGVVTTIAASLAANSSLVTLRLNPASTRKAYLSYFRMIMNVITVGSSAGVPGCFSLQRFTAGIPTTGTARSAVKQNADSSASDMYDIRDLNSAMGVAALSFGDILSYESIPNFVTGSGPFLVWEYQPEYPLVLTPGDGVVARTQVACPATQTWNFSWTARWEER